MSVALVKACSKSDGAGAGPLASSLAHSLIQIFPTSRPWLFCSCAYCRSSAPLKDLPLRLRRPPLSACRYSARWASQAGPFRDWQGVISTTVRHKKPFGIIRNSSTASSEGGSIKCVFTISIVVVERSSSTPQCLCANCASLPLQICASYGIAE